MTVIKNDVILQFNNTGSNRYSITFEYDRQEQVRVRTYNATTNEYEYITDFEFDGPTTLVFTGVVPSTFEIVRVTDISNSYGTSQFSQFVPASAIKAAELNGNLELLRQAIEENTNGIDNNQDQIDDIKDDITDINNGSLDGRYVNVTGDTMTGSLSMSNNKIDGVANPSSAQDAVNLHTLEAKIAELQGRLNSLLDGRYVNVTGDTMTGILRMSTEQIKEVQDPTSNLDAVNLRTLREYLGLNNNDPDKDFYSFTRADLTAAGGEISIDSGLSIVVNKEFVYLNGKLLLADVDYVVNSDNQTIDFTDGTDNFPLFPGDLITVLAFTSNSVISKETIVPVAGQKRYTTQLNADFGDLNIVLNGTHLLENDRDYGMVNEQIFVFTEAPLPTDTLIVYQCDYTKTHQLATTTNRTRFSVNPANVFTAGEELVLQNGSLLNPTSDYTVVHGRHVELTSPALEGDSILILTNT